jgi:hypothetical protein
MNHTKIPAGLGIAALLVSGTLASRHAGEMVHGRNRASADTLTPSGLLDILLQKENLPIIDRDSEALRLRRFGVDPDTLASCERGSSSPREPRIFTFWVCLLDKQLEPALTVRRIVLPSQLVDGVVRSACYNATTYPLAYRDSLPTQWLVAMDIGLELFVGELAKVAALATPIQRESGMVRINLNTQSLEQQLELVPQVDTFLTTLILGRLLATPTVRQTSIPIDSLRVPLVARTLVAGETFVYAHELGHVVLRHRGAKVDMLAENESTRSTRGHMSDSTNLFQLHELAADSFGADLTGAAIRQRELKEVQSQSIAGIDLFFTWAALFDSAVAVVRGPNALGVDHPPAEERRMRVRQLLTATGLMPVGEDFGEAYHRVMMNLWNTRVRSRFLRNRALLSRAIDADTNALNCLACKYTDRRCA